MTGMCENTAIFRSRGGGVFLSGRWLSRAGCGTSRVTAGIAAAAAAALIQPKPILAKLNFFQPFADGRGRDALESAVLYRDWEGRAPAMS